MKKAIYIILHRVVGIFGCLLDLGIQIMFTATSMFRRDPEMDDTESFYHK